LVVEDRRGAADALGELLATFGCRVLVAYDEGAAQELARRHHPDVVLWDLSLARPSGYMPRRRVQMCQANHPFLVAITGFGGEDAARRAALEDFEGYLVEPVDPSQIRGLLRRLQPFR